MHTCRGVIHLKAVLFEECMCFHGPVLIGCADHCEAHPPHTLSSPVPRGNHKVRHMDLFALIRIPQNHYKVFGTQARVLLALAVTDLAKMRQRMSQFEGAQQHG